MDNKISQIQNTYFLINVGPTSLQESVKAKQNRYTKTGYRSPQCISSCESSPYHYNQLVSSKYSSSSKVAASISSPQNQTKNSNEKGNYSDTFMHFMRKKENHNSVKAMSPHQQVKAKVSDAPKELFEDKSREPPWIQKQESHSGIMHNKYLSKVMVKFNQKPHRKVYQQYKSAKIQSPYSNSLNQDIFSSISSTPSNFVLSPKAQNIGIQGKESNQGLNERLKSEVMNIAEKQELMSLTGMKVKSSQESKKWKPAWMCPKDRKIASSDSKFDSLRKSTDSQLMQKDYIPIIQVSKMKESETQTEVLEALFNQKNKSRQDTNRMTVHQNHKQNENMFFKSYQSGVKQSRPLTHQGLRKVMSPISRIQTASTQQKQQAPIQETLFLQKRGAANPQRFSVKELHKNFGINSSITKQILEIKEKSAKNLLKDLFSDRSNLFLGRHKVQRYIDQVLTSGMSENDSRQFLEEATKSGEAPLVIQENVKVHEVARRISQNRMN